MLPGYRVSTGGNEMALELDRNDGSQHGECTNCHQTAQF